MTPSFYETLATRSSISLSPKHDVADKKKRRFVQPDQDFNARVLLGDRCSSTLLIAEVCYEPVDCHSRSSTAVNLLPPEAKTYVVRHGRNMTQHDPTHTAGRSRCSSMVDSTEVINHCSGRYHGVLKGDKPHLYPSARG